VPHGSYKDDPVARPAFEKPELKVVEMPLPTTYVTASFPAPSLRDEEFPVAAVALNALREKLFEEVRTKRQLSYDPGAGLLHERDRRGTQQDPSSHARRGARVPDGQDRR
jgi:zinc protease